jgi:hypothetical protein
MGVPETGAGIGLPGRQVNGALRAGCCEGKGAHCRPLSGAEAPLSPLGYLFQDDGDGLAIALDDYRSGSRVASAVQPGKAMTVQGDESRRRESEAAFYVSGVRWFWRGLRRVRRRPFGVVGIRA